MIKAWNRNSGSRLSSFYLELMVESILRGMRIADYPGAVAYVFWRAQEVVRWKLFDPAGLDSGQVNGLARGSVPEAVAALARTYALALDAVRLEQSGLARGSKERWRRVFGDPFPAS
jgi:hypothetical protein